MSQKIEQDQRSEIRAQRKKKLQAIEDKRRAGLGFNENNKWTFEKEELIKKNGWRSALRYNVLMYNAKKEEEALIAERLDEIPLLSVPFEENESIDKPASKKRKMEPPIPPPPVIFTLQPSILQQIPESIKRNVLSYYSSKLSAIYNS